MTPEEKNNIINYIKKYKKLNTEINIVGLLIPIFITTNLIFLVSNEKNWTIMNFIFLIISIITIFVMFKNRKQLFENIFLLLKDYKIITINEEIIKTYNKEDIINAAKNNKTIDLSINKGSTIAQEIDAQYTSAIELLKQYPDLNSIKKVQTTYTINELILDYQKDIIKICNNNIPDPYIKYEATEPIGKAKLKNKED
jgi:hypothetical protein